MKYNLIRKIKMDIIFNKITLIIIGTILFIGVMVFKNFLNKNLNSTINNNTELFSIAFIICLILIALFLIIYPLLLLLLRVDNKKILKSLKHYNITEKDLFVDYNSAIKYGKTKIGNLCTYTSSFYHYYVIPNQDIFNVYISVKERTNKKAIKYKNGAIQRTTYNIAATEQFYIKIMTLKQKTISILCDKKATTENILNVYKQYPHILFLDPQNSRMKREIKKARIERLKQKDSN